MWKTYRGNHRLKEKQTACGKHTMETTGLKRNKLHKKNFNIYIADFLRQAHTCTRGDRKSFFF